jgi:hypothetical protein
MITYACGHTEPSAAHRVYAALKCEKCTADDRLRCFAINQFGDGEHPHADSTSLHYFKAPYVRDCLLKCAASENVMPFARERAADLAELCDELKNN